MKQIKNWSGSVNFTPKQIHIPTTEDEVIELVKQYYPAKQTIRVVGSAHSFTRLIETDDVFISLDKLEGIISVDREAMQATVWGGTKIKTLGADLSAEGMAQANLGDIDVQSIAGAISTGTHGSGVKLGSIATQVVGLRLITGTGDILDCSETENREIFKAAQVSMGLLGIITRVTLQCVPAYSLDYNWYSSPIQDVLDNLDTLKQNRNFEFFWFPHTETTFVKTMNITDKTPESKSFMRWVNENIVENGILWLLSIFARQFPSQSKNVAKTIAGLTSDGQNVTASHDTFATLRLVKFQEMEYNIPVEHFEACLTEIKACITEHDIQVHFPIECRFVHSDDILLSPAYQRESAYIAVHKFKGMPYRDYFDKIESIFRKYDGRPHWGKLHTRSASDLRELYPRWGDFMAIRQQLDSDGIYLNAYLKDLIAE